MAWETRKGTFRRYYTRSHKRGGRVYREYVGRGAVAEAVARLDAMQREEREMAHAAARTAQAAQAASYARLFGPLDILEAASSALVAQALTGAGYQQHDRGEWRRKRGSKDSKDSASRE